MQNPSNESDTDRDQNDSDQRNTKSEEEPEILDYRCDSSEAPEEDNEKGQRNIEPEEERELLDTDSSDTSQEETQETKGATKDAEASYFLPIARTSDDRYMKPVYFEREVIPIDGSMDQSRRKSNLRSSSTGILERETFSQFLRSTLVATTEVGKPSRKSPKTENRLTRLVPKSLDRHSVENSDE